MCSGCRRECNIDVEVEASGFVKQKFEEEKDDSEEEEEEGDEGDTAVEQSNDEPQPPPPTIKVESLPLCPSQQVDDEVETTITNAEGKLHRVTRDEHQDLLSAVELQDQLTELLTSDDGKLALPIFNSRQSRLYWRLCRQ